MNLLIVDFDDKCKYNVLYGKYILTNKKLVNQLVFSTKGEHAYSSYLS